MAGYVVDRIMSARDALQPLELSCFFDAIESGGQIAFRHRGQDAAVADLTPDTLVESKPGADLITLTRAQETDLPASARISYSASESEYRQAVAEARRLVGASGRVALAELPVVMEASQASQIAEAWLFETWAARDRAAFSLPPSRLAVEPGDPSPSTSPASRACCASPRSAIMARATSRPAASIPTSTAASLRSRARRRRQPTC